MTVWHDLRHALRLLHKNPGFTLAAVFILALGIGANAAIFSVLNAVLLKPLLYPGGDRIVAVNSYWAETGHKTPRLTGGDLQDVRAEPGVFEAISPYYGGEIGLQLRDSAEFTRVYWVNAPFFRVFGVQPEAGRFFDDRETGGSAVVSSAFAARHFGTAAAALGQPVHVENRAYEITGVVPAEFEFPQKAEVWLGAPATPQNLNRTAYNYRTVARLSAGTPIPAAQAQLDVLAARLAGSFAASNKGKSFLLVPLTEQWAVPVRSTLYLLMAAVGLVLLIACANVGNLVLARSMTRAREIAVRAALGAGRWRIVRQLLVESLVLAFLGGALGVWFAYWGVDALVRLAPAALPRTSEIRLDLTVLAFAAGASVLSSVLFGLAPAWQASRAAVHDALKAAGTRGTVGGAGSQRVRNALVVAEIALSVVLATAAGLLARSLLTLNSVDTGYRKSGILVMYAHAPASTLDEYLDAGLFFQRLSEDLSQLPGVRSAAGAVGVPAGRYSSDGLYAVEGREPAPGSAALQSGFRLAGPGYFATMGIPLRRGRDFTPRDDYHAPFAAIVSEALARQAFPAEDPIGKRVRCGLDAPDKWMTIVGVVGDVRQQSPASDPAPELYMPLLQHPYYANELQMVMRTSVEPASLAATVREKVRQANPAVALKFTTIEEMVAGSVDVPRFRTLLVGCFAGLAILLAIAGLHAVMTCVVAQRRAEFGLRVALGATANGILRLVLVRAARLTVAGLALGLLASLASVRLLTTMLFGVAPGDPLTYAGVLIVVAAVTLAAAGLPAWRAAQVEPAVALREE